MPVDSKMVHFILPGQPIGKPKLFNRATGFGYNDKQTINYMHALGTMAKAAMGRRRPFEDAVRIEVLAIYEIPASWPRYKRADAAVGSVLPTGPPDCDNVLKTLGDACKGIVWRDDALITDIIIRKRYGARPALDVVVCPVESHKLESGDSLPLFLSSEESSVQENKGVERAADR